MIHHWLYVLFAPLVGLLGSDDFATRERASAGLRAARPASDVALRAGMLSPNPEIAFRSRRALVGPTIEERGGSHLLAWWLIVADFPEHHGLPWLPGDIHRKPYVSDLRLRRAIIRVGRWLGVVRPDELIALDPDGWPDGMPDWTRDNFYGLDDIRFRWRGLVGPSAWLGREGEYQRQQEKWAEIKKRRAERDGN